MSIAKDIIQEVREDAPKLLLEDSNSPFSSKNLNNMIDSYIELLEDTNGFDLFRDTSVPRILF